MPKYDKAGGNSGRAMPGTVAVRDYIKKRWPSVRFGYPFGIYANRPPSEHAEGRGLDGGMNASSAADRKIVAEIKAWAIKHADFLGTQSFIFNNVTWGFGKWYDRSPASSPHTDHFHFGQNKAKSRSLTLAQIEAYMGSGPPEQEEDDMTESSFELRPGEEILIHLPPADLVRSIWIGSPKAKVFGAFTGPGGKNLAAPLEMVLDRAKGKGFVGGEITDKKAVGAYYQNEGPGIVVVTVRSKRAT